MKKKYIDDKLAAIIFQLVTFYVCCLQNIYH